MPKNDVEIKLHQLWCEILNLPRLSVEKEFGFKITIEMLIKNSTIEKCAKLLQ